ncbi:hypothetical protein MRB53_019625 [Persea americana]|uniref:Uncharacterized protein n=1 Tax=Persea americana TaxID=3435 RepID=A0ACC2KZA3_PERAE|nr:hypothetical protein MRB53_019625 [Persea americana]
MGSHLARSKSKVKAPSRLTISFAPNTLHIFSYIKMSRPHDGQRPFFPFGNPFRMILPKGSYISPKLLILLNTFEQTLAASLEKLNTNYNPNVLSLSWIKLAIESLCETHTSIKTLITELQFPVSDWDDKWIDLYLDNSVKLLDVCIAFSAEISRFNQGQLLLQYVLHILDSSSNLPSSEQLVQAGRSLHELRTHQKERAFNDLQANVNGEIRRKASDNSHPTLKELEAVYEHVEKLCDIIDGDGHKEAEILKRAVSGLTESSEALSDGLDLLSKDVEGFFQIGLTGRDALLYNLRASDLNQENNVEEFQNCI